MRRLLAVVAAVVVSAIGAAVLGEYELEGTTPIVAGVLFGLIVGEVVTAVGGRRDVAAAAVSAVMTALGMVWAAWRSTGPDEHWSLVPDLAWGGVVLGAVAAFLWVRTPGRRGAGSPREP